MFLTYAKAYMIIFDGKITYT